ncbi:MAG: tetratricopeptide repeat protein [Terrimicrobiaceae bacterium]
MKAFPIRLGLVLLTLALVSAPLRAQSPGAAAANEAAYTLFSAGDYAAAATAYEKILKDYPTDAVFQVATIQLAFSQFFLGQFDPALATLNKALAFPGLSPELAQVASSFLPQILSAKASSLPAADPKRKAAFEDAIKKFTDYVTKYPQAPEVEAAVYGRAVANFQIGNYDKVVEDMESNIQKFPNSGTLPASKNVLSLAQATLGSAELMKEGGDKAKGMGLLNQAADHLRQIIAEKKDVALINDAYFQIGEILFTRAAFSPEADREALYQQALEAYRSILPKEEILGLQQEKIKAFPSLKAAALRVNNQVLKKQLDKDNERELRKLEEIKSKPDQIATAILKMGEIFFNAQKYNESRVLLTHVNPFLSTDEEKVRSLYYKTMGYVIQNSVDKAVAGYQEFNTAYKGKEIAESLPFAMGNMYLGLGNPTEAIRYFDESVSLYPKGRLVGLSVVSKAQAEVSLKNYEEALKTFQTYLAKNPTPDVAVVAQYGLAGIYKDTGKWDDAIAAYKIVKEKYPTTPQAIESDYWTAIATQQKGDNAAAIPLLEAFIKNNEKHALTPLSVYALGGAQIATGKTAEGAATLAMLAEKYPDSQPAPYTYFMRAQLAGAAQKTDEVNALMKQFIEKYPKDDKIYFAFDSIGQNATAAGKPDDAIANYTDFVQRYSENPKASEALYKIAELQRGNAERLAANYSSLNAADQTKWKDSVQSAVSTAEDMLARYPASQDLALGLQSLLASQRMLLRAELKTDPQVEEYFQQLSEKTSDAGAKSKILFTLSSYISEKDKPRALAKMNEAFDAAVIYSPKDLDIYGLALVEDKKPEKASEIFKKLAKDYPNPPGTTATTAPAPIQEAQAIAIFGLGRVAQESKQTAEAGKYFQQLKALYPWSPKVLEADYGIAESLRAEGKLDDALLLLPGVIRAQNASADLRAKAFLLGGFIMKQKTEEATDAKKKEEARGQAIDFFTKIAQFYAGVPIAASEGLWQGGQLLEEQAGSSTDPKFKVQQTTRAKECYKQLVKDYPDSAYTAKAQERLTALGVQ